MPPSAPVPDPAVLGAVLGLLARGDGAEAERLLAPLRSSFPGDGDILDLSGIAAHLLGRPADAVALTAAAVATDPASAVFHANHGAALAASGRVAEAVAALERSLACRPDHAPTQRNLGLALAELGRTAAALPVLYRARELAPDDAETHLALARCLREAGAREAAADAARDALACRPPPGLAEEARLLAAPGTAAAPERAPAAYVRLLFDAYAPTFDRHLCGQLAYRTPEILAEALRAAGLRPDATAEALDLGCGTGLSGLALRAFARSIVGIDISPRMLAQAAGRGLYARLVEAELPLCLEAEAERSFDLAFAADVMIYLGAPEPLFRRLARIIRPGGLAALSFERMPADPAKPEAIMDVSDQLRFRHLPDRVHGVAVASGFAPVLVRDCTLRLERGAPVEGFVLVMRRD